MSDRQRMTERLEEVFRDVFDDDGIDIFDAMTAEDVEEWDSLMHITLMVATEQEFGMRLNAVEVGKLRNVGALIDLMVEQATK